MDEPERKPLGDSPLDVRKVEIGDTLCQALADVAPGTILLVQVRIDPDDNSVLAIGDTNVWKPI